MSLPVPMTAGEANQLIKNIITRTRPVNDLELYQALNYGIGKAVRAISASRPQYFCSWVEPFTIGGGVTEYDVSSLSPSLFRPWRLICTGRQGQSSVVLFRYASITSHEFEEAEVATAGAAPGNILYDVLDGLLPAGTIFATGLPPGEPPGTSNGITVSADDFAKVQMGNFLVMPNAGAQRPAPGMGWEVGNQANDDLTVFVLLTKTAVVGGVTQYQIFFQPDLHFALGDLPISVMRRRVIKMVPPLQQQYTGRLWYVYNPPRMRSDGDPLPAGLADRHIDMVVAYAVGLLKRSVDDTMENRWALEATEMRSELMQDTEPIAGQNTESLGSALDWMPY